MSPFLSQEVDVNGIKFSSYNAGHVLGAAMFMIEIAGVKVFYTGDFSCEEDRHLMAAEIPSVSPDILISVTAPRKFDDCRVYEPIYVSYRNLHLARISMSLGKPGSPVSLVCGCMRRWEEFTVVCSVVATVHDIVTRGGRCLIPVFALGRAQELLLILGE